MNAKIKKNEYLIFLIFLAAAVFNMALKIPPALSAGTQEDGPARASRLTPLIPYCKTVMIIPLDSRPANVLYPSLICKIAGFEPLLPPAELMDNFKKTADCEKIAEWMTANAGKADAFVISATMLCYGGLVASRTPEKHLYQALKNLKHIENLKKIYPEKPVFVYDIIQRLAVTASSEKDLEYYNLVRQWAILEDKIKTAPEAGDAETHARVRSQIPQRVFDDYMKARKRNNAVNVKSVQMCAAGRIDYLVLGQDDASKYGIHKSEARALRNFAQNIRLDGRYNIFPGADEIDAVLIARLASFFYKIKPKYRVVYPNAESARWIAPYEDIEISENIKRHIEVSGGRICDGGETADIILALNATAENEIKRARDMNKITDKIAALVKEGKLVAAADLSFANRSDTAFVELLSAKTDITELAAYSAWNTAGNKIGFALGQASARWHSLNLKPNEPGFSFSVVENGRTFSPQTPGSFKGAVPGGLTAPAPAPRDIFTDKLKLHCARAHYELLMLRFLKDYSYKNFTMKQAEKFIASAGADRFDLKDKKDSVQDFVARSLAPYAHKWFERFKGKHMKTSMEADSGEISRAYIKSLENLKITLPWPRIFECEINYSFGLDIQPVK